MDPVSLIQLLNTEVNTSLIDTITCVHVHMYMTQSLYDTSNELKFFAGQKFCQAQPFMIIAKIFGGIKFRQ